MPKIEIESTLGIPAEEILARRHNLWIGISDAKWFRNTENLAAIVNWARDHTRSWLLILIPGVMYATNYFHLEGKSRARALDRGFAAERFFVGRITEIVASRRDVSAPVDVATYYDLFTPNFTSRNDVLLREFAKKGAFYERIMEIAKEYLTLRQRPFSKTRAEAVALYLLQEIPMMIAPLRLEHGCFNATVYPGLGAIDYLVRDLIECKVFPELSARLKLPGEPACGLVNVRLKE